MELKEPGENTVTEPREKTIKIAGFTVNLTIANIFFAFLSTAGQVGIKVTLPLWIDSTISAHESNGKGNFSALRSNLSTETKEIYKPEVDAYFVLAFGCIVFFVVFGAALVFLLLFRPHLFGEAERTFPRMHLFLPGFFNALNGVLIVFASSGTRTAPYLQAIIANIMIPLIIALRYMILRKAPTIRQFICALIVLISLFICLIPKIFTSIDPDSESSGGASGAAGILWPLCYMFGSVPGAVFLIVTERNLQVGTASQTKPVNLVFYLFWMHVYQLLTVMCFFWADFVPGFGYTDNIYHFWENWVFGCKCFFGGAGCSADCGVRGTMFVVMYLIGYIGSVNLAKFSEGATYVAIVNAIVTPLGFLFWTLFRESPFRFDPAVHITTWFSIGGIVPMVPAIFLYTKLAQGRK